MSRRRGERAKLVSSIQRPKTAPNETEASTKSPRATDPGVLGTAPRFAATRSKSLIQPLRNTNPGPPTHYEPEQVFDSRHESKLFGAEGQEPVWPVFPPCGRRPILARLRHAEGRVYGRQEGSDLRSPAYLKLGLFGNFAGRFAAFSDVRVMERNTASIPTFFTERTLAAYLAVSDRTIRNWIRRGELSSYKLGAARRIDPADVDAFLEARREEAA